MPETDTDTQIEASSAPRRAELLARRTKGPTSAQAVWTALGEDRAFFVRYVAKRTRGLLSPEEAEDVVQIALERDAGRCPQQRWPHHRDWFCAVLQRRIVDFLRARDGRTNRSDRGAVAPRPRLVPWEMAEEAADRALFADDGPEGALHRREVAGRAEEAVQAALRQLSAEHQQLIKVRCLSGEQRTNDEVARLCGVNLKRFERQWSKAWRSFSQALSVDAAGPRCHTARVQLGAPASSLSAAERVELDAHLKDCASCAVFEYRAAAAAALLPWPVCGLAFKLATAAGGGHTLVTTGGAAGGAGSGGASLAGLSAGVAAKLAAVAVLPAAAVAIGTGTVGFTAAEPPPKPAVARVAPPGPAVISTRSELGTVPAVRRRERGPERIRPLRDRAIRSVAQDPASPAPIPTPTPTPTPTESAPASTASTVPVVPRRPATPSSPTQEFAP